MPTAVYLYGFARPAPLAGFAAYGVVPRCPVLVRPRGELAAVVSEVPREAFESPADPPTAADQERIIEQAVRHNQVIEAVFARGPVLPARFGALFSSASAVDDYLAAHAAAVDAFLTRTAGREEWAVTGEWQPAVTRDWLLAADPELAARRAALPATPGARFFGEKKLLADADRKGRAWADGAGAEVRAELLAAGAEDHRPRTAGGREVAYADAFLVPTAARDGWLARLDALAARFGPAGLTLTATGPWPPGSFAPPLGGAPA